MPRDNEEDIVINSVEDLGKLDEEEEGAESPEEEVEGEEEEANQPDESEGEEDVTPPAEEEEETPAEEEKPNAVKIGDEEYSKEELEEIFSEGKRVKEYKSRHPGFDPILLHRDYTQKAMELAELKKKSPEAPATDSTPKEQPADLAGINPQDIEVVEKILKARGYVSRSELKQIEQERMVSSYETVKNQQLNDFIQKYPMYHPSNDKDDKNWSMLLEEFGLYKQPSDPTKIGNLLERAHNVISGNQSKVNPDALKLLAQKKANKLGESKGGGTSGGAVEDKKKKVPTKARAYLKGFSDEELEEIFN